MHFASGTRAFRGNVVKPSSHNLVRLVLKAGIRILRGREGLEVKEFELITSQVLKGVLEDLLALLGISRPPSVDVSLAVCGGQEEAGFALVGEDEMLDDVVFLARNGDDEDLQLSILWDRLSWTKRGGKKVQILVECRQLVLRFQFAEVDGFCVARDHIEDIDGGVIRRTHLP